MSCSTTKPELVLRIITLDSYMSQPIPGLDAMYSDFRGSSIVQVPVLRIFGSTKTGKKMCLHVHGVFPYLYVPLDEETSTSTGYLYQVAGSIDKLVNISLGQASSSVQHVYKIAVVSGMPFYGYHPSQHQFLKIYTYNPILLRKITNLLYKEPILGKLYQPHEAHIPFTLQFMIDYNLHGMSFINLSQVRYRDGSGLEKQTHCELEADAHPEHILNRLEVTAELTVNPGIAALWEDERQRRRNKDQASQIGPCLSLERNDVAPTDSHLLFKQALLDRLAVLSDERENRDRDGSMVYPPETPSSASDLLNASFLDVSLVICSQEKSSSLEDTTLDADGKKLLEVLENLADECGSVEHDEEESITSQLKQEGTDEEEQEQDMSVSLDFSERKNDESVVLVPQLDGANDSHRDLSKKIGIVPTKRKIKRLKTLDMPNLDEWESFSNIKLRLRSSNKREEVTVEQDKQLVVMLNDAEIKMKQDKQLAVVQKGTEMKQNVTEETRHVVKMKKRQIQRKPLNKYGTMFVRNYDKVIRLIRKGVKPKFRILQKKRHYPYLSGELLTHEYLAQFYDYSFKIGAEKFLDGANDSDSSGDENAPETNKKRRRTRKTVRYSALPIDISPVNGSPDKSKKPDRVETVKKKIFSRTNSLKDAEVIDETVSVNLLHESNIIEDSNSDYKSDSDDIFDVTMIEDRPEQDKLDAARRYDKLNRYNPIEGTSADSRIINSQPKEDPQLFSSGSSDLTPYQKPHQPDVTLVPPPSSDSSGTSQPAPALLLTPKNRAPTRKQVIDSLASLDLPAIRSVGPFYSRPEDVTGAVEVGLEVLKVNSKSSEHQGDFVSIYNSLDSYRREKIGSVSDLTKLNQAAMKNLILSYTRSVDCFVTPAMRPPSRATVSDWLLSRKKNKKSKIDEEDRNNVPVKVKSIRIALSQDEGEDDDETDLSLTITPTPLSSQGSSAGRQSPIIVAKKDRVGVHKNIPSQCLPETTARVSCEGSSSSSSNKADTSSRKSGQITGVMIDNTYGFDTSVQNLQDARAVVEREGLTVLVIEVHVHTRGDLHPDPTYDPIAAIFYSISNDTPSPGRPAKLTGMLAVNPGSPGSSDMSWPGSPETAWTESEPELLELLVELIRHWDPDILAGYEMNRGSLGYLIERGYVLGINLPPLLSRLIKPSNPRPGPDDEPSELRITGRIVLNVWRLLRKELAEQSYTFEHMMYRVLQRRVPLHSYRELTFWWDRRVPVRRYKTVGYYILRVEGALQMLEKLDVLGRTSELAKLIGIQFFEVLTRGSQFCVESMMLRLAKPMNYIPVSPSEQQRAKMRAPEHLALILEPESKFYPDPVIVLDFQSLYPSMMIAYNYCFSTCLGRVDRLGRNSPFEFGASQYKITRRRVRKLAEKDLLNYSPCGVAFVKKNVRDGILPRMLREILDTRLMVKAAMKENKGNAVLQRVLHNRQLGLKLIANVTYGYSAANFSGRMPSVEVADSIVAKGKETLRRAIAMVESRSEWRARVVYGDTDSLFVLVPGRSRREAFTIGEEIAKAVTEDNPSPVKLKLEKVYQPCVLQTKKRYVGYMYESRDQDQPVYDAKGIETVRRDGCPAVSKMLERCLRVLFESKDVSRVKEYVLRQFDKILTGRVSVQDLTFAKEYRGPKGYKPFACVPALEIARKRRAADPRSEPLPKQRVPYVIANGPPGVPLIRLVKEPWEMLKDPAIRPNALYYITRVIAPPINRCFQLIGVDVIDWFNKMPRVNKQHLPVSSPSSAKKSTISQYFPSMRCVACSVQTQTPVCESCSSDVQATGVVLYEKLRVWERKYHSTKLLCMSCMETEEEEPPCLSLDCPVAYRIVQTKRDLLQACFVRDVLDSDLFNC